MDCSKFGSGDNDKSHSSNFNYVDKIISDDKKSQNNTCQSQLEGVEEKRELNEITPQAIDDNETILKDRIAQCRDIIESLKIELNEEKAKIKQNKSAQDSVSCVEKCSTSQYVSASNISFEDVPGNFAMFSDCVDSRLGCDENLLEYEKQLQRYQNTLNMAQIEKKNAIRKQMLTKAYRLKLLEVENQCNIELLRVKQSLQCLEPLKMIANKWQNSSDDMYDTNSYELVPIYPQLSATSNCDMNVCRDILDGVTEAKEGEISKDN